MRCKGHRGLGSGGAGEAERRDPGEGEPGDSRGGDAGPGGVGAKAGAERRAGTASGEGAPGAGVSERPGLALTDPVLLPLGGDPAGHAGWRPGASPPRAARLRLSAAARPQPPPPPRRAAWGRAPRAAPPCYENFPAAAQLSCLPRRAEPSLSGGEGGRGREEGREGGREAALSAPAGITCSRAAPPRGTDPGSRRGCCEVLMGHGGERETDANGEGGRLRVTAPVIATEYTEVGARRDFPAVGINTDYYFFKKVIR